MFFLFFVMITILVFIVSFVNTSYSLQAPRGNPFDPLGYWTSKKASVMAKYLVDSKARVDPSWYRLADEIVKGAPPEPYMEIPQLWNMRGNSRIKLQNGRLIDMVTGGQSKLQAIYGGVEFGLDRFELAQRHALQGQPTGI